MRKKELDFILQEGEGFKIEFKENLSNIDKEIVAFANAEGGRIFLGISDDNKVKGINVNNHLKSQIQDIARNCDPPLPIKLDKFDNIMIIKVNEGSNKPYKCTPGFYLRQGSNSQKLTRDEILDFSIGEGRIRFDEQFNTKFDYKKDFDKNKLNKFLKLAGLTKTVPYNDILINLDVAQKQENKVLFKNSGILLFAKDVQKFVRESYFTCVRYKGSERVDVIDRFDIYGDLIAQVEEAIKFLKKNIRLAYKFVGQPSREEVYEYPLDAVREAIINAVMHRDYYNSSSNVYMHIYSDRIEIINPGGLFKGLKAAEFGKRSVRRNRLLADLFQRVDFIEKIGSGIERMKDLMKKQGLREPEFEFDDFFTVTFYGPGEKELGKEIDISGFELNNRQKKAIEYLKHKGSITRKDYENINNISKRTSVRDLNELLRFSVIKTVGKGPSQYYVLK